MAETLLCRMLACEQMQVLPVARLTFLYQPKVLAAVSKELAIIITGAGERWLKFLPTAIATGKSFKLSDFLLHSLFKFLPTTIATGKSLILLHSFFKFFPTAVTTEKVCFCCILCSNLSPQRVLEVTKIGSPKLSTQ